MTMKLPYLRAGAGTPLVLVHGYLGGSAQWADQLAEFSSTHDVIAPDLPGFAKAASLPGPDKIADFAAAVIACLDQLNIGTFVLLGHSMGGMIVQEIAARQDERIERLVLYGTGPLGSMPDRFEPLEVSMDRLKADGVAATAERISATWFRSPVISGAWPILRLPATRFSPCASGMGVARWQPCRYLAAYSGATRTDHIGGPR
jgi:pimeloyl-ACP methyl ester carboxylesterase